jgi:protein-S-isoprenylcysteine O-methyltransferase Ste14
MLITYILSGTGLIGAAYIVFRIIVRNDYLKRGKLTFLSGMLELTIFVLHANFMYLFIPVKWLALPEFPDDLIMTLVAKIFLYSGLLIILISVPGLGLGPTMGRDKKKLKQSGLYSCSRNPQVIGYGLFLIAFALCYPSLYALGWIIMYVAIIAFMIKSEEEFLAGKYGDEYKDYCQRVPRIIRLF